MARERRTAFGEVAELYDRARPSYPDELVDDVIALLPAGRPQRALEVGAGTGKATILFAQRGLAIRALEPLPEMAVLAQRNCERYPHVTVERAEFEPWDSARTTFDLLYSAQAWHWIDPELRYRKARSVLATGGVLAAFWNRPDWEANPVQEQIDEVYRRAAPELLPNNAMRLTRSADTWGRWHEEIGATSGFERPEVRTYPWTIDYTSGEYLELLRTHSDHIMLDPRRADDLYDGIGRVIDDLGGVLRVTYSTRLCLARRGSLGRVGVKRSPALDAPTSTRR
jgi:SAM-dependent methyltransferase